MIPMLWACKSEHFRPFHDGHFGTLPPLGQASEASRKAAGVREVGSRHHPWVFTLPQPCGLCIPGFS